MDDRLETAPQGMPFYALLLKWCWQYRLRENNAANGLGSGFDGVDHTSIMRLRPKRAFLAL